MQAAPHFSHATPLIRSIALLWKHGTTSNNSHTLEHPPPQQLCSIRVQILEYELSNSNE